MHLFLALRRQGGESRETALPACPGLARLLHHAGAPSAHAETSAELLAPRYGIARQVDWPLAPLRLAALGVEPGEGWWLAADPVTQVAGRDGLRVAGRAGQLTTDDARALLDRLNAHFAADGLAFVAPRPDRWFVRAPRPMDLATSPLTRAVGRSLRNQQPRGADAGIWRRWQSEIEMLLHGDPVNVDREQRGLEPVNSVWLSGGGVFPQPEPTRAAPRTFADDEDFVALARHAQARRQPLPERLAPALGREAGDRDLVVVLEGNAPLTDVEQRWTGPAWQALLRGALAGVTVMIDDGTSTRAWTVARPGWAARLASRIGRPDLTALLAIEPE